MWSSDLQNEEYLNFKNHFANYTLPKYRKIYQEFKEDSLVTKISNELEHSKDPKIINSAKGLVNLLNMLIGFRKPHLKMADEVYIKNQENSRSKGSGGYTPSTLKLILELNRESKSALEAKIKGRGKLK